MPAVVSVNVALGPAGHQPADVPTPHSARRVYGTETDVIPRGNDHNKEKQSLHCGQRPLLPDPNWNTIVLPA